MENNMTVTSIVHGLRKSIRRISDYYSANNKIIAQRIEKNPEDLNNDSINLGDGDNSDLSV